MDKLTNHLFVFKGQGEIKDEYCSYSELRLNQLAEEKQEKYSELNVDMIPSSNKKDVKISYKDKYEYEQLSKEIQQLEDEKKQLELKLSEQSWSFEEMQELSTTLNNAIGMLDSKTDRWLELDELISLNS